MKICMITTSFPRSLKDDSGIFVFRLCRALAGSRLKVDVVAPADGETPLAEEMGGVRVTRVRYFFPRRWQRLAYGPGGIPANLKRNPWLFIQVPFFILMLMVKGLRVTKGADIVHAQWLFTGLIALPVKMIRGIPYVVTLRGSDVLQSRKGTFTYFISLFILKRAALITTVNQDIRGWVTAQGIPEERVVFLRNGVEVCTDGRSGGPSSGCSLLYVGSLIPRKGVHCLIEAFSQVIREEKEARLVLIGDGGEQEQLRVQVKSLGLGGLVTFVGAQAPDKIPSWMNRSDCLVLPSLWEGTPNVVLEAMACGLPVVASDLPGIREVMQHGVHGLLSKPEDVGDLAQNILKVVRNKRLRLQMGQSGREEIIKMNLGWDQVAKRYQEVYTHLCAASRAS